MKWSILCLHTTGFCVYHNRRAFSEASPDDLVTLFSGNGEQRDNE